MRLTKLEQAIGGLILAAIAAFNWAIPANAAVHTTVTTVSIFLGAVGIAPAAARFIGTVLPPAVVYVLGAIATTLGGVASSVSMSNVAHAIIGGVLALLTSIGIGPAEGALPPASPAARRQIARRAHRASGRAGHVG